MHMAEIDVPHQLVGEEGGVDGHEKFQFAVMLRLSFVCTLSQLGHTLHWRLEVVGGGRDSHAQASHAIDSSEIDEGSWHVT